MGYDTIGEKDEGGAVCVCTTECPLNCRGECDCPYCHNAYEDFLSADFDGY